MPTVPRYGRVAKYSRVRAQVKLVVGVNYPQPHVRSPRPKLALHWDTGPTIS